MIRSLHSLPGISFCVLFLLNASIVQADSPISAPAIQVQQQVEPLTVGVLDLDPNNVSASEVLAISERLRYHLGQFSVFQVIERKNMTDIMDELGFQFSGACDTDDCVVQVGKILGARKMVAGSVSLVGTVYSLQIRIIDIATSSIEHQALSDVEGIEQVFQVATEEVARELAQRVTGGAGQYQTLPGGQPLVITSGTIRIVSNPAGADVTVGGINAGSSPRTLSLSEGSHFIQLDLEGYYPYTDSLAVIGGENRTVNLDMVAIPTGQFRISTDIDSVTVLIDGEVVGTTPFPTPFTLYRGEHLVELQCDSYDTLYRVILIQPGSIEDLSVVMLRSGEAQISLNSSLQGARVDIDGARMPYQIPREEIILRPGKYTIEVKAPGYAVWRQVVELDDGESQTISVILNPKSRITASMFSTLIPGLGQFYSRRPGNGAIVLIAHGVLGYLTYDKFSTYKSVRDEHRLFQVLYNEAETTEEIEHRRFLLLEKADEMHESRRKLTSAVTLLGGIWALNILDTLIFMPRLRVAGSSLQGSLDARTESGTLFVSLRIAF